MHTRQFVCPSVVSGLVRQKRFMPRRRFPRGWSTSFKAGNGVGGRQNIYILLVLPPWRHKPSPVTLCRSKESERLAPNRYPKENKQTQFLEATRSVFGRQTPVCVCVCDFSRWPLSSFGFHLVPVCYCLFGTNATTGVPYFLFLLPISKAGFIDNGEGAERCAYLCNLDKTK